MKLEKRDIIIIVLAILNVIVLAILVFIHPNNNTVEENTITNNMIDISECYKNSCNKKIKFNNNILQVIEDKDLNYQLSVNNKFVLDGRGEPYLYSKIFVFDNNLIISTYSEDVDVLVSYIYDIKKEELEVIKISDDARWNYKNIEVKDNVITYQLSKFNKDEEYTDLGTYTITKIDSCLVYKKYMNEKVFATYESKYENGKISSPSLKEEVSLSNYKDYSKLCK